MPNFQEETAPWYGSKYYITSVVIEDGITSIGAYAFSSHDHILSIQLPDSLTMIGVRAFWGCSALPSTTIPRSVNLVDTDSLYFYSALKDIWYGGTQEEWDVAIKSDIGNATVYFMTTSATEQKCGDSLTWSYDGTMHTLTISGTGAMYDYDYENPAPWDGFKEDITAVIIDGEATAIGTYAFGPCDSLATATIPASVTAFPQLNNDHYLLYRRYGSSLGSGNRTHTDSRTQLGCAVLYLGGGQQQLYGNQDLRQCGLSGDRSGQFGHDDNTFIEYGAFEGCEGVIVDKLEE